MKAFVIAIFGLFAVSVSAFAQSASAPPAPRSAYLDTAGVVRWRENDEEVRLFGANYCAFSGSDYRTAGRVTADRKAMIDEDMAHFARMGWDGMRLCSWGDWENADARGNLIENEHSDLMDYLIAKARERGISMLLTPIHTYNPGWPDQLDRSDAPGFSRLYERGILGRDRRAIAAETNYISQVLNHVNPYTGIALKDDPAIVFVEMINEPVHHPEDLQGSIAYIDALVSAVRSTGSQQITFHNLTQDFRIGEAIDRSTVQGITMGWYPSGLVAGRTVRGNFLQAVDSYPEMLRADLADMPRIVYEFDQADLISGYMFPAMARTYRSVGAQFASIFAYDMLQSAPYNLGWQTHYINLVHTPRKAVSGVIAGEAMRRLPRMENYGRYPDTLRFGDFRVSYEDDMSELVALDAYMNAGDTTTPPRNAAALQRVVGLGSSPVVRYEGTGAYFLDKVRDGVWRLELYPDQLNVAEPFAQPQPGRVVSRLYHRAWPMHIALPDLGARYTATPVIVPENARAGVRRARGGAFEAEPGVWLLSRRADVDLASMPAQINRVGFREYHVNARQTYPDLIRTLAPEEFVAGAPIDIRVQVASEAPPQAVTLLLRQAGTGQFRALPMTRGRGYDYSARLTASDVGPGLYEYVVTSTKGDETTTFPGALSGRPGVWPFAVGDVWRFTVTPPDAALVLFDPERDHRLLSFVRPEENFRGSAFHLEPGETSDDVAFSIGVPEVEGATPEHYAAALFVGDAVAARGASTARSLAVRFRASGGARKTLDLLLIEKDGSSWRGSFVAGADWSTARLPLQSLEFTRSILIPTPFPGLWNYWREGPAARAGGTIQAQNIERLEIRVRRNADETARDDAQAVDIESVWLEFGE